MKDEKQLPELPIPKHRGTDWTGSYFDSFTADQMRAYALASIHAQQVPARAADLTDEQILNAASTSEHSAPLAMMLGMGVNVGDFQKALCGTVRAAISELAAHRAQAGEAVAIVTSFHDLGGEYELLSPPTYRPPVGAKLYASPHQVALTDDQIDSLSTYWVYIRSGRESEQYEELREFARAIEMAARGDIHGALEMDTSECDDCAGKGWNWEHQQVAERLSDTQEFKIDCPTCSGRGYVGPDATRRAVAEAAWGVKLPAIQAAPSPAPAPAATTQEQAEPQAAAEVTPSDVCDNCGETAPGCGGLFASDGEVCKFGQPAPAPAQQLSDEQIEALLQRCGGKWNGDYWVIEDADLHPFVRAAMQQKGGAV